MNGVRKFAKFVFLFFLCIGILYAEHNPKILVLHSYHPSYKWTNDLNNGINSIFNDLTKVDLYVEYMDTKKYSDNKYFQSLKDIYYNKYHDIKFDVIISSDNNAFNFLKKYNSTLFKNSPVVFSGTNYIKPKDLKGYENFTGVNEKADIKENYELILKLHPNTKNIYTIIDTTQTGKIVKKEAQKIASEYKNKDIKFHIIDDLTYDDFISTIKKLPKNSALLLTVYFKTKDNRFLEYYKAAHLLEENTNTPIYALWDFVLGHGIIGGYLTSGFFQGESSAKMAKQILEGRDVKSIPVLYKSPNRYMFDYRKIRSHNINENDLPLNSIFINKETSFYEIYYKEIISAIIVFIFMFISIIILLINIKRRKNAEEFIKKQLIFQQDLIDNVNTPIYYKNLNGEYIGCNKAFEELMQMPRSQILNKTAYDIVNFESAKYYQNKDTELLKSKQLQEYEGYITSQDGETKDLIFYKNVFYEDGKLAGIVGAIFDITESKALNYELNRMLSTFDKNVIASKADEDGNIIYVSEAFCKVSDYTKEELIGKGHSLLRSGLTNKKTYKELWESLNKKQIWMGELINKKKNGQTYTLQTIITPEYDKNGQFVNYTAISEDITAKKLIEQAKTEIETLNEEITDTQKEIIFRLGAIAEVRSKETGQHVKRVAEYSKILARHYGLSQNEAEIVKTASPMHDIGKIAIPDAILNKPGRYTSEEFEIMKAHAKIGYDMLKESKKAILKAAAIIAHEHQEKYDGSGYPRGLSGEDIHIYGRITAVADVFDALGSERVYKKAWPDEAIFEYFKKESGKHFDPILINLFFKNLDEFLKVRDNMKDL